MAENTYTGSNLFQSIDELLQNILDVFKDVAFGDKFAVFEGILVAVFTLMIMYKGYEVIAGRTQSPLKELAWDFTRKLIILAFVLNTGNWLTLSTDALNELYEWAGGKSVLFTGLDQITDSYLTMVGACSQKITFRIGLEGASVVLAPFYTIVCATLGYIILVLGFAFTIISVQLTNTILVMLLPGALFCWMWDTTKNVFSQYLNLFLSNLIVLLLYTIVQNVALKTFAKTFTQDIADDASWYALGNSIFITCIILVLLIKTATGIAQSLASVALDSVTKEAMTGTMGVGGMVAGKSAKGVFKAGVAGVGGAISAKSQGKSMAMGVLKGVSGFNAVKNALNSFKGK